MSDERTYPLFFLHELRELHSNFVEIIINLELRELHSNFGRIIINHELRELHEFFNRRKWLSVEYRFV